jgi:hypothetical protein
LDNNQTYPLANITQIPEDPNFDKSKKTVLFIHGYKDRVEGNTTKMIVAAYLTRNDHNTLALDWEQLVAQGYILSAVPNTFKV